MSLIRNFIQLDPRCRRTFLINMVWKGWRGMRKFKKRRQNGKMFPAFQFISVTDDCNLKCQGCWVYPGKKKHELSPEKIHHLIDAGRKNHSYFFGILGGEPLLYKSLFAIFESNRDCYFQLFTNGTLFTESTAETLRKAGNVTPLFSFEGDEEIADIRRGGHNIYNRTLKAIETSAKKGLVTGVAVSVCKSNIDMALSETFLMRMHDLGVLYVWFYIFRPVGENPSYELALSSDEILRLRRFLVDARTKYPVILIDSYWRANGEPFCPAAEGLSHHINASGYVEPCPVIQIARDRITEGNLATLYDHSTLLKNFRNEISLETKGCILMENPAWLANFASFNHATNTSNRENMMDELIHAPAVCSHGSCEYIPEKNLLYRIAKKTAFFGMGAYG